MVLWSASSGCSEELGRTTLMQSFLCALGGTQVHTFSQQAAPPTTSWNCASHGQDTNKGHTLSTKRRREGPPQVETRAIPSSQHLTCRDSADGSLVVAQQIIERAGIVLLLHQAVEVIKRDPLPGLAALVGVLKH
mmetsp:Transcript_41025/g.108432  ORF Transcript_41025/g.108432 Transcript_41025/m.108432 type:complete len:135 (-) Transcript_41025:457-861(-)